MNRFEDGQFAYTGKWYEDKYWRNNSSNILKQEKFLTSITFFYKNDNLLTFWFNRYVEEMSSNHQITQLTILRNLYLTFWQF